ncbi:fumarate reductase/succinate dehydrogenase flavoprotein subunit [Tunturiibacter gelidoferens]|uniref:Succinate dehydrogenase / fumarate reductase flavoprotein subunit n=1 Tax=Tunturiibacter gelidiferens TaxID=3069689 RepID=A0A9X0QJ09_9BACT|nr:fumarate reductase/succinate dehydrogenase flavoprotein subunit [Edaphobacter lichenicola]MBB5331407.1 succinate dehydrogenase / fumarate reductase flavoprotein subunit [Edaphobacter lichenicola]
MPEFQRCSYDVLVIGAGGAGLRAAIEAGAAGAKVGVVCKSLLGKAHTVMAEGGIAAALANVDDRDNWRVHFADTMRGGQYLNNWRMAELHAKEAPECVRELEAWGALFDRTTDGKILQRNFGGHRYPRLAHVGDRTGLEMIRTLQDHGIHAGMEVHMECTVLSLLLDGNRIAGACGYDRERGRFQLWEAKAVVLATGGIGRAFKVTSNSWEYTGDGLALAYRAGAELQDMEFVQFHPTGMVWPISVSGILVTEGVRGEGGILRNSEGRRFMFDDIPDLYKEQTAHSEEEGWRYTQGDKNARRPPELLTRDHVARCINREVKAGRGSPHGGVFLDISWIKERMPKSEEHIKRKLPSMYHQFKQLADLDITKEPMEVGPTTHYMMGGIRVDGDSQMSNVPGLFAAGEAAAGLHGANRLGGNSLSDLVVFGRRAGRFAAEFANANGPVTIDEEEIQTTATAALAPFDRGPAGENPYQIQYDLQETMQDLVGIVRVENEMQQALDAIGQLRARAERTGIAGNREYNNGWHTAIDIGNMMIVSEAITRAALLRKESRGAQFREDFPNKDSEWGKYNIVISRSADGEMQVEKRVLTPIPNELKKVIEEMK